MTRNKLTSHQREVNARLQRLSRHTAQGWVSAAHIGSRHALDRLVEKGCADRKVETGPRGGEHKFYRPTDEETES